MAYQKTKPQDASIVIVCNHTNINCQLSLLLKTLNFKNIICKGDHENLIRDLHDIQPDLIVLHDIEFGKDNTLLLQKIRAHFSDDKMAIILHSVNCASRKIAWENQICDYIHPCISDDELKARFLFHIKNSQNLRRLKDFENMMKHDIKSALNLQYSLMPQKETLTDIYNKYQVKVDSLFKPCQYLSGDLWGVVPLDDHRFGVWVCDFVSKGLHAALSTFRIHTLIKDQVANQFSPNLLLESLNSKLKNLLNVGNFATFLYGVVDADQKTFTYAAAGSTSPIFYNTKTKKIIQGDSSGLPLGIECDVTYDNKTFQLDAHTSLLLYSDLLWECSDDLGFSFDTHEIDDFFNTLNGDPVIPYVSKKLDEKNEKFALSDDLTLIEITF